MAHESDDVRAEEPLLTIEEVARLLHVSVTTVRRLVAAGQIPEIRIGRLIRFHPDVVRQLRSSA